MITFGLGLHKYSARARARVYNFYFLRMRHGEIWRGYSEVLRVTSLGAGTNLELARLLGSLRGKLLLQGHIIKQLLIEREMKMCVKVRLYK